MACTSRAKDVACTIVSTGVACATGTGTGGAEARRRAIPNESERALRSSCEAAGGGVAAASSFIETRSAGQSVDALVLSISEVLIATGVLSVLFVPIVTWLGRMKAKGPASE
jgi:hypothetical protein